MTEKRRHRRLNRRLSVRYGEQELTHTAFTTDLSSGGCFITSARLPALHTRLHVQLLLPEAKSLYFEAEVRRHKQVPTGLTAQARGGFSVRFLPPAEAMTELLGTTPAGLVLRFPSAAALAAAWTRELRVGGVFVPTSERLAREATVEVQLNLTWAERTFAFEGRVVHVSPGGASGPAGVGVAFHAPDRLQQVLRPFLS
jgi:Tfp pilus assembly protein PilZ